MVSCWDEREDLHKIMDFSWPLDLAESINKFKYSYNFCKTGNMGILFPMGLLRHCALAMTIWRSVEREDGFASLAIFSNGKKIDLNKIRNLGNIL
jgi:hypothetical protein